MKNVLFLMLVSGLFMVVSSQAKELKSGEYAITQTWVQETNYKHPYFVVVPEKKSSKPYPVFIYLHGNGGTAKSAMRRFTKPKGLINKKYIMVFPQGYKKSWNIISERSQANELDYIESIIRELQKHENVDKENFSIMGHSNGAAMANQMAIETKMTSIKNYITGVSPLNTFQHDGKNFKIKGDDNSYEKIAQPLKGIRLMNISGEFDKLVPYSGGPSKAIPARDGKLPFVHAEDSIYYWAKLNGYKGEKLTKPSSVEGNVEAYIYNSGDFIHYKIVSGSHGATHIIKEEKLLEFLEGGK
ncbi:MAG: hypothetical protein NE330_23120 [Lentisphaeraceae bacterium]|nr:hypothetical protein [Lentisphaeraceae bacterium]